MNGCFCSTDNSKIEVLVMTISEQFFLCYNISLILFGFLLKQTSLQKI